MKTPNKRLKHLALTAGIVFSGITGSGSVTPANALSFTFTNNMTGMPDAFQQSAMAGFTVAGDRWAAAFSDPVNVNVRISFRDLGKDSSGLSLLGQTSSSRFIASYPTARAAFNADAKSADDRTAVANLPATNGFNLLINQTKNNPNPNPATPYLDAYPGTSTTLIPSPDFNNTFLNLSTANAKALNLPTSQNFNSDPNFNPNSDGSIDFSSTFTWDFDPSNGIDAGAFDFVGIATHELGHVLGFTSGVDVLDFNNTAFNDSQYINVNTLDLFRYSVASKAVNAIDWTADSRAKYFSLDGGLTSIAPLSTGTTFGDQRQASHWKDGLNLGIMRPTFTPGVAFQITPLDLRGFDAIGWDLNATAVPEPDNFLGTLVCAVFAGRMLLKQKKKLSKLTEKQAI